MGASVVSSSAARVVQGQQTTTPGVLTVDSTRILWAPLDESACQSFAVALQALSGTLQKAKSKPQMRIPTLAGPLMLEFASVEARDAAIAQITPILARKALPPGSVIEPTGAQAEVKKELLQEDRDLRGLYDELVRGEILSDADFWRGRQDLVTRRAGGTASRQQVVGLSSALLAQLQTSVDGKGKQMKMTITPQFIQQVFAEKPHVHRAFAENVPQKMSDVEFWTRFAKHEIQMQERRKKASKRSHEPPDPLFSRLTPQLRGRPDCSGVDPTVNLAADTFDNPRSSAAADVGLPQGGMSESIARDMNLHSAVVLQGPAAIEQQQQQPRDGGASSSGAEPSTEALDSPAGGPWRPEPKGTGLEDLRKPEAVPGEQLHIRNPRRYFERTAHDEAGAEAARDLNPAELAAQLVRPSSSQCMDAAAAEQVLLDLHREGASALPESWVTPLTADALVPQMQTMLRQTALVSNELLRQFWRCFPLRMSVARERRATKLREHMDKKYTQLENMQGAAEPADRQIIAQLLRPVMQALDAGLEAYQAELSIPAR